MADANLLVTYDPAHPGKAKEEVENNLKTIAAKAEFLKSGVDGLFQLKAVKPKEVVKKLIALCKKKPKSFEVTFHYVPIDEWVKADVKAMQKVTEKLGKQITPAEKWKLNLNKRKFEVDTRELITKLTEPIERPKVDLSNPDMIVQVEIVGKQAGISLLAKDELLEVSKIKG